MSAVDGSSSATRICLLIFSLQNLTNREVPEWSTTGQPSSMLQTTCPGADKQDRLFLSAAANQLKRAHIDGVRRTSRRNFMVAQGFMRKILLAAALTIPVLLVMFVLSARSRPAEPLPVYWS